MELSVKNSAAKTNQSNKLSQQRKLKTKTIKTSYDIKAHKDKKNTLKQY